MAGCSPIREGVLLIKPDTTLDDVRRFGEECQRRWGITPLQIFLHKDEGHWLNGKPDAEDRESFQVGGRWFKPNYHAHIVFDWMSHDTGKSCKLNDDDLVQMQTLASDILSMERGQSKTETGKEHLERNDFILEKQKAELQRIEAERQHKEQQIDLAEQELKQVKSEIRTDKLKSVATDTATALASSVGSLFGSGKMKSLERKNEDLRDEIATHEETIEQLQAKIQTMQNEHRQAMMNKENEHRKALEAKETKHNEELNFLKAVIAKATSWFPFLKEMLRIDTLCRLIGFDNRQTATLVRGKPLEYSGELYSEEHNRRFTTENAEFKVAKDLNDNAKLDLYINRTSIKDWFKAQFEKSHRVIRRSVPTQQAKKGLKL